MIFTESDKISLLKAYDKFLDKCADTPSCLISSYAETVLKKCKFNPFINEHIALDKKIIKSCNIKELNAFAYIQKPDFNVQAYYYNPVYEPDFNNLSSISQSVVIAKVLRCYFPISDEKVIDVINNPKNNPDFYGKLVQCMEVINHSSKNKRNLYDIKGFLDKDLLKLGLRVTKIMVAPGVYKVVEDFVPVYSSLLSEVYFKLLNEFKSKYHREPSEDEYRALYSEALRLACDIELEDGTIIKNPHTFDFLWGIKEWYSHEKSYFDFVYSNPYVFDVYNWQEYKARTFAIYGVKWKDDYSTINSHKQIVRKNIWNVEEVQYFDNRLNNCLEEQKILFKK